MLPGPINRYESATYCCQISFGEDAHIKTNHIFHQAAHSMGIRDRNPIGGSPLTLGPIAMIHLRKIKSSIDIHRPISIPIGKALVDMSNLLVDKGVEMPYPYGSSVGLNLRSKRHDTPEEVSGGEGMYTHTRH